MKKGRIVFFLLALLVASALCQNCATPNPSTDLIDAGKVSLMRRGGNRQHCFPVTVNYNIPNTGRAPDIAVGVARILGYGTMGGFDYSVTAARRALTNTIAIVVQINEDNRWASLQISYLVSSNTNFIVGSFIANLVSLTSCVGPSGVSPAAAVETYIPTFRINQALNYQAVAYLTGVRTVDSSFNVRAAASALDKVDGRLSVQVQSNASPGQQYVYITYVVFPTTTSGSLDFSIGVVGVPSTYRLEGVAAMLESGAIEYSQFTICGKNACPPKQVQVNGRCDCIPGLVKVGNACWQACTQNGYINEQNQCVCMPGFQLISSGRCVAPITCRGNQVPQPNGACDCRPGFIRNRQGNCIPGNLPQCLGPNEIQLDNGSCGCQSGFSRNHFGVCTFVNEPQCNGNNEVLQPNGVCGCKEGFYRSNQNTCLAYCGAQNQVWNGGFCDCAPGFVRVFPNMQCVKQSNCPNNQILIGGQCQCQNGYARAPNGPCLPTTCSGANEVYNPNTRNCDCANGFIRVGPACVNRCGINAEWKKDRCFCIQGNGLIDSVCRPCPAGATVNANQICVCQGNTILITGSQPACLPCPANSIANNNECTCIQGYQWNNGRTACVSNQPQCPVNGYPIGGGRCACNPGFVLSQDGRSCNSFCPANSRYDSQRGCTCLDGFDWSPNQALGCVPKETNNCPANSAPNQNGACICIQGFRWNPQGNGCVRCPSDSTPVANGNCLCNSGYQWSNDGLTCQPIGGALCPPNSSPGPQGCNCNSGFQWTPDRTACVPVTINCPQNAFVGPQGLCVCNNGLYLDGNVCKPIPTCPLNSIWDQAKLLCLCQNQGQNLISGVCRPCPANQFWNSKECVCSAGFFRVAGVCRVCDPATTYNGSDCVCNIGYFGTRDKCNKCHESCGKCTGPDANNCVTCADITFSFSNGYCAKNTPCAIGNYLNGSSCAKCSDYCQMCVSELECGECSTGFKISLLMQPDGTAYSVCEPDCGDGRKVDIEKCDDGNLKNGDGCSSTCTVEDGWSCSGGTSVKPSLCAKFIPTRTTIQVKGAVNMIDKVVQGVRLSYIPQCFTDLDCRDCFKILQVRVIEANVPIVTSISYVPNSDGQFIIEYKFGGIITSTYFKYQIQLSRTLPPQYAGCFSAEDYAQQVVNAIDTATLALADKTDSLTLEDLTNPSNTTTTPGATNSASLGSVLGYPKKVIDLLFK